MPTVRTTYLHIAYEEWGDPSDPAIVLVHGWPDDVHCWEQVVPHLTRTHRVIAPHLRGHGRTRFRSEDTPRSGQIAALGHDLAEFLDAVGVQRPIVVGHDWGARAGYVVGALYAHLLRGLVAISAGYGSSGPRQRISYELAHAYWYEWFVKTERGRRAFEEDRGDICRYLWQSWSPGWHFDDAEFETASKAWDNEDWPNITVHAYLQRWGEAPGAPEYDELENRLSCVPSVKVPTLVLHGNDDADNLPHTTEGKEAHFVNGYQRRLLDGVGHFVPREAPARTAAAILEFAAGISTEK
ncbi:alpha/beta hydrolase [Actinoallomurus sp. NPDC052274]|uniref:alpha/beta fold hydrolase n=1 Tax=Actinoallomurus sp. NPDC052274 TaxID=3155420 RepID=UPI00342BA044